MTQRSDERHHHALREVERKPLADTVCVVTGGSGGIGKQIAAELAAGGATIVVNYWSSENTARDIVDRIESDGGRASLARVDITDYEAVVETAEGVRDQYGPIDVLVNNAGITVDKRFERLSREDWDRVIGVNLGGAFNCTKAFYEDLKASPNGRLINISSVVGQQGSIGQVNYAASKSGLFGFTKALARELAPYGTTANCVAPGYTMTDMVRSIPATVQNKIRETIPLDRFGSVEEIACIVRFLAGAEASYVTGEIINANGGLYA